MCYKDENFTFWYCYFIIWKNNYLSSLSEKNFSCWKLEKYYYIMSCIYKKLIVNNILLLSQYIF